MDIKAEIKAKELVEKYERLLLAYGLKSKINTNFFAKEQAIICVEEIIDATNTLGFKNLAYWQEVLTHLKEM